MYIKIARSVSSAERIHANNVRRVIRALEIFHTSGEKMSEQIEKQEKELLYDVSLIGLTCIEKCYTIALTYEWI